MPLIEEVPWKDLSDLLLLIGSMILGGYLLPYIVGLPMRLVGGGFAYFWDNYRGPIRFFLAVIILNFIQPTLDMSDSDNTGFLDHLKEIFWILGFTWFALRSISVGRDYLLGKYDVSQSDNLRARKVVTQIRVMRQVLNVIIWIVSIASILMSFDGIRQFGMSILASAGVAGIIIGFAAQRSIANIFAGLQIAITQPIRLDDVVIVEGEWGRIEEITLTYIVVKIWDERRLIVPIMNFIERPFQNWTRVSSEILGTVFLYLDYSVPLDSLRDELHRILGDHPKWDKRVAGIQVTNTTQTTMEVRILVSARDASSAWDLRCDLREMLIQYLQRNYPNSLPRFRVEMKPE